MRTGAERGDQLIGGAELGPLRCRLQQPGRRGGRAPTTCLTAAPPAEAATT